LECVVLRDEDVEPVVVSVEVDVDSRLYLSHLHYRVGVSLIVRRDLDYLEFV